MSGEGAAVGAAERGAHFLSALRERRPVAKPVGVVVAHPDDESIGIGAQLARLHNLTIVLVTDGAPTNAQDANRLGFASAEAYRHARAEELVDALSLAGVDPRRLIRLDVPDQQAAFRLPEIAKRLVALITEHRWHVAVTHAYEGGHPDHDATALAVHAACAALPERQRPAIVEMPLYHAGPNGWVTQLFTQDHALPEVVLALSAEERAVKQKLFAAHASQAQSLSRFSVDTERFRPAPAYDFSALPNGGELLYERYRWGMTGARFRELASAALAQLPAPRAA